MKHIGTNIMILRECEKVSQDELAEKLDVSRQTVYKWENGLALPSIENLQKMATIYGCSIETLCEENLTAGDYNHKKLMKQASDNLKSKTELNTVIWERVEKVVLNHADEVGVDEELLATMLSTVCDTKAVFGLLYNTMDTLKKKGASSDFILEIVFGLTQRFSEKYII